MTTTTATTATITKSDLMRWYNRARAAARRGDLDAGRVNRALGLLQSREGREKLAAYATTTRECRCKDRQHHAGTACKHMVAVMVLARASQS